MNSLSDAELVRQLETLAWKEFEATLQVLLNLGELDKRRTYLKLGYSSSYAFCTRKLKYSEPAAYRRISAARIVRDFPEALKLLETRAVTFTTLALISPVLRPENAKEIFDGVIGKSKEMVERFVALRRTPTTPKRDTVRAIAVRNIATTESNNNFSVSKEEETAGIMAPALLSNSLAGTTQASPIDSSFSKGFSNVFSGVFSGTFPREGKTFNDFGGLAQERELKFKINFEVGEGVIKKLRRMREIRPYKNLAELFDLLLDNFLKRNAPENKRESEKPSVARVAPAGLRAMVLKRDNYQCSFIGEQGERCNCRSDLEIDHVKPVALGGRTEVGNLRTLCSAHNRFEARRVLGEVEVGRKVNAVGRVVAAGA